MLYTSMKFSKKKVLKSYDSKDKVVQINRTVPIVKGGSDRLRFQKVRDIWAKALDEMSLRN